MYTTNFEEAILVEPSYVNSSSCTTLRIITGYTDIEMISSHLIKLQDSINEKKSISPIKIEVILGMTNGAGLTEKKHKKINLLVNQISKINSMPDFSCYYIYNGPQVHSKVYIWYNKDDKPVIAFCGSANYSVQAFRVRRECMTECNAQEVHEYYEVLKKDSISCVTSNLSDFIQFAREQQITNEDFDETNLENLTWEQFANKKPILSLEVSLLTARTQEMGYGSGLNWGIRRNNIKRDRNQAYIPFNKADRDESFFPNKTDPAEINYPVFKVIPSHGEPFLMRRAQASGKGLHSAASNAILGEYFRRRLNVPDGTFITKEMLLKHGRTTVTFKKFNNNIYTMEF